MMAWFRFKDGGRSHTWPVDHSAKQDGDAVVFDGYRIEGAELIRVESLECYRNAGDIPEDSEPTSLIDRLAGWFR